MLLTRLAQLQPATHPAIGERLRADLKVIVKRSAGNGGADPVMPPMAFELVEALGVQLYKVRQCGRDPVDGHTVGLIRKLPFIATQTARL